MTMVRRGAHCVAITRVAIGAAFVLAPDSVSKGYTGSVQPPGGRLLARSLGVRDLLLGVGLHRALRRHRGAAEWMAYGTACELVDLVSLAANERARGRARPALLAAVAGAAAGDVVLTALLRE